jgi:transposase
LVEEAMQPGLSVSYVARRHGVAPSLLFAWKRRMQEGGFPRRSPPTRLDNAAVHGRHQPRARAGAVKKSALSVELVGRALQLALFANLTNPHTYPIPSFLTGGGLGCNTI